MPGTESERSPYRTPPRNGRSGMDRWSRLGVRQGDVTVPSKETQTGVGMIIGLIVVVALAPLVMAAPIDSGPGYRPASAVAPVDVLSPSGSPDPGYAPSTRSSATQATP